MRIRKNPGLVTDRNVRRLTWGVNPYVDPHRSLWITPPGAEAVLVVPSLGEGTTGYIADVVSPTRYGFNDVDHSKVFSSFETAHPTSGSSVDYIDYINPSGFMQGYGEYPISAILAKVREFSVVTSPNVHALVRAFGSHVLPNKITIDRDPFDTNFSIWYLFVDLVDLKKLIFSYFGNSAKQARLRRLRSALERVDRNTTARELHNANLMTQFGLLPTIDDITTFVTLLKKWRDVYDPMSQALQSLHNLRVKPVTMSELQENVTLTTSVSLPEFEMPIRISVRTSGEVVWHATAQYKFTAPEFKGWTSRLKQFIDAFGVLDPAAVWDVIPFSFIVDWFVHVGEWLHQNRPRLFPADIHVLDYCESIKSRREIVWSASWNAPLWSALSDDLDEERIIPVNNQVIASQSMTTYVRRRFKPTSVYLPLEAPKVAKSFLSLRRASISASLIAQRLPR